MTTLDLNPELESRLQQEAARQGIDIRLYIANTLLNHLQQIEGGSDRGELDLRNRTNFGLPPELWREYRQLEAKLRAETLTPADHARLISLSDRIEQANVVRITKLIELAQLRGVTLEQLMRDLGLIPFGEPSTVERNG